MRGHYAGMALIAVIFAASMLFMSNSLAQAGFCSDGETRPCGNNIGQCKFGTQTCVNGFFGICQGGIRPDFETCDNKDNDCDGVIDNRCGPARPAGNVGNGGYNQPSTGTISGAMRFEFDCGDKICERGRTITLREGETKRISVNGVLYNFKLVEVFDKNIARLCIDDTCFGVEKARHQDHSRFSIITTRINFDSDRKSSNSVSFTLGESNRFCSSDCKREPICGNKICESGETDDNCGFDCRSDRCGDLVCSFERIVLSLGETESVNAENDIHKVEFVDLIEDDGEFFAVIAVDDIKESFIGEGKVKTIGGLSIFAREVNDISERVVLNIGENHVSCEEDCRPTSQFISLRCGNNVCENKKLAMEEDESRSVVVNGKSLALEIISITKDRVQLEVDNDKRGLLKIDEPKTIAGINFEVEDIFFTPLSEENRFTLLRIFEDSDTCQNDC